MMDSWNRNVESSGEWDGKLYFESEYGYEKTILPSMKMSR
jgi:hypothetical protein